MKYDFTTFLDRHGKDSIAVDIPSMPGFMEPPVVKEGFSHLPMWVADMNFATAPVVVEHMMHRIKHPIYGYFRPQLDYFKAIIHWQESHHQVQGLEAEHIGYENGVLGGVVSALKVLCSPGDKVLVHAPTYVGFSMSLKNNGYDMISSPLVEDEQGICRMDYKDMDEKLKANKIHTAIFCSPHNPCGRVWERWEIEKAMEVYEKNQVYVISDEIWADLILDDNKHIPTQMVSDYARTHTVALYAPSKTFNLAGLIGSYHIIYNPWLRDRVVKQSSLCHYNDMNVLSMHALIGAYSPEGEEWLGELKQVLSENVTYAYNYVKDHFAGVTLHKPQGTYVIFIDCALWCKAHKMSPEELLKLGQSYGVIWQSGAKFASPSSIRINLASPLSVVKDAFDRLDKYVFNATKDSASPELNLFE